MGIPVISAGLLQYSVIALKVVMFRLLTVSVYSRRNVLMPKKSTVVDRCPRVPYYPSLSHLTFISPIHSEI